MPPWLSYLQSGRVLLPSSFETGIQNSWSFRCLLTELKGSFDKAQETENRKQTRRLDFMAVVNIQAHCPLPTVGKQYRDVVVIITSWFPY